MQSQELQIGWALLKVEWLSVEKSGVSVINRFISMAEEEAVGQIYRSPSISYLGFESFQSFFLRFDPFFRITSDYLCRVIFASSTVPCGGGGV